MSVDLSSFKENKNKLLITYHEKSNTFKPTTGFNKFKGKKNVSISIASGITAFGRIFMSQFKNNPNLPLLYSDTDSLFVIGDLDPNLIGNKLGQFKLEYIFKKCIILSPKVYGGILEDGSELIKVKGLKKDSINKYLTVDILESLLHKDSNVQVPNLKFIRDFEDRSINLRNDLYT